MNTFHRSLLIALLVVGCTRGASVTVDASAPLPSVVAPAPQTKVDLEAVVRAWNAATNAHDAAKLAALYAAEVELYGQKMSREKAAEVKRAAFAKHDRDDLSEIALGNVRALFRKQSRAKDGSVTDVKGYLEVDSDMKIVSEGDTTTDANLARSKEARCSWAMLALAESIPEVKPGGLAAHLHHDGATWGVSYFELGHAVEDEEASSRYRVEVNVRTAKVTFNGNPVKADVTAMRGCGVD